MRVFQRSRRWWVMRFRTSVVWQGEGKLSHNGWEVGRPDWWTWGSWSSVTRRDPNAARKRLDEWQDERWAAREALLRSAKGLSR